MQSARCCMVRTITHRTDCTLSLSIQNGVRPFCRLTPQLYVECIKCSIDCVRRFPLQLGVMLVKYIFFQVSLGTCLDRYLEMTCSELQLVYRNDMMILHSLLFSGSSALLSRDIVAFSDTDDLDNLIGIILTYDPTHGQLEVFHQNINAEDKWVKVETGGSFTQEDINKGRVR